MPTTWLSDRAGGGEVGWANVWKTQGGAVGSLTNIYSLLVTEYSDAKKTQLQNM